MSKINIDLISFTRTDYSTPSHLEQFCKDYAEHFKVRRNYVPQFCKLIQVSKKWKMGNLQDKLNAWEATFSRLPGTTKIIDLVNRSFTSCQNDNEITDLRGIMVEALIIGCNGGETILASANYGWGARVDINLPAQTIAIHYNCVNPQYDDCYRRSTVDFGYWNGYHG